MSLSQEDALRLQILLANKPLAIRIDESRAVVHALMTEGESRLELKPNCRQDQYIKRVREALSGHYLGSPGGYPVYLSRWTRMGQMRDESLETLLLLGEPEAVVAAVCAAGLDEELARRAWWAMEDADNARQMLGKPAIAASGMGPVLARYLVEYLPFETEADRIIASVALVLQPGLIDEESVASMWKRAARKAPYLLGFLAARPDSLPTNTRSHPELADCTPGLQQMAGNGDAVAGLLHEMLDAPGQAWLATVLVVLERPASQEVVNGLLELIARRCAPLRPEGRGELDMDALQQDQRGWLQMAEQSPLARECPRLLPAAAALRLLSGLGYGVVRPLLRDSTASGTLLSRKLEPLFTVLRREIGNLLP